MDKIRTLLRSNIRLANRTWGRLSPASTGSLNELTRKHSLSVAAGEILLIDGRWYITHAGLLRVARRCAGIQVEALAEFCDPTLSRYAFKATVFRSRRCKGFVGYGDADPSNVSSLVHGAEMRVAETARSTELCARPTESASARSRRSDLPEPAQPRGSRRKLPPQPATTETAAVAQSVTVSASSFVSINSMPTW